MVSEQANYELPRNLAAVQKKWGCHGAIDKNDKKGHKGIDLPSQEV